MKTIFYFLFFSFIPYCFAIYDCYNDAWQLSYDGKKCYRAYVEPLNWYFAEDYCQSVDGECHLVSIANAFDNSYVSSYASQNMSNVTEWWLGGGTVLKPTEWSWSDGANFSYTNWAKSQSCNNTNDCCITQSKQDSLWYMHKCLESYPFICEVKRNTY